MRKISAEIVVGMFVLVGIVALAYLSIKLGKLEVLGGDYYEVFAEFDSISGLKSGAGVEIAGVEIGRVGRISLNNGRASVLLLINTGVTLQEDTIASVRTRGVIGDKFVKLSPGGSEKAIEPGGRIRDTESAIELEELVSQFIQGRVE